MQESDSIDQSKYQDKDAKPDADEFKCEDDDSKPDAKAGSEDEGFEADVDESEEEEVKEGHSIDCPSCDAELLDAYEEEVAHLAAYAPLNPEDPNDLADVDAGQSS